MEIEGFDAIINIITLAKELHSMGRYDIVKRHFFDRLDYDNFYENMIAVIESVFSSYYVTYRDDSDDDRMIFMDDVISNYYCLAWEYGKTHKISHEMNPYVKAADQEVRKWLNFSYSLDWNLFGYTKSKSTARKSKLIIYVSNYDFCEYDQLAYRLLMIYKWFSEKSAESINTKEVVVA